MQLAIDWLGQLLEALREHRPAAKTLIDEALEALDLAESSPGDIRLTALLDKKAQPHSYTLIDSFSGDLAIPGPASYAEDNDPFAEDPYFGLELDIATGAFGLRGPKDAQDLVNSAHSEQIEDSVAEEQTSEIADQFLLDGDQWSEDLVSGPEHLSCPPPKAVFDPFAGDPSLTEDEGRDLSITTDEELDDQVSASLEEDEKRCDPVAVKRAGEQERPLATVIGTPAIDPFADDPELTTSIENELCDGLENSTVSAEQAGTSAVDQVSQEASAQPDLSAAEMPADREQLRQEYVACAFELAGHTYYLPIEQMREIADMPALLPLPLAPPIVRGLINLHGRVIPVIDLSILNPGEGPVGAVKRLVVGEYQGEQLAFLAEGVPLLSVDLIGTKVNLPEFLAEYRISGVDE